MISAASPEMIGVDSLVPPNTCMFVGWLLSSTQPLYCGSPPAFFLSEHSDQPRSPGANASMTLLVCEMPAPDRPDTWLLVQCPLLSPNPYAPCCAYTRSDVEPPAPITHGSDPAVPYVLPMPASPVSPTTVTPASTASWLKMLTGSFAVSGYGFEPNDSLMTSTCATFTA